MRLGWLFLFLGFGFALLAKAPPQVIGYLPHYRAGVIDALPYERLTDLIFFSVEPRSDGSIGSPMPSRQSSRNFDAPNPRG